MSAIPADSAAATATVTEETITGPRPPISRRVKQRLTSRGATAAAIIIATLWTIPTFGLFISSFRPEDAIQDSGWWTFFSNPQVTLENYADVLASGRSSSPNLGQYFINSLAIVIPGTIFPLVIASMAAYVFAWGRFRGKDTLFIFVFALQIVPLQMALIPLLSLFINLKIGDFQLLPAGTYAQLWIAHTIFALPLAIFLLHNFISEIPNEVIEAARVDGAGHATIFWRIILPLSVPAIASFGIFQFLWVWNDLLVALVFSGGTADVAPITQRLAELTGTRGNEWHRLTAGAFISMIIPLAVFFGLQRYFVRGLLAGGLKG
ncbi:putative alpha-glucoside ABC transport system,permease [Arthrobacter crystallopoietes BAB-32]|uniref:Putative alpha-glucoside ABC transport system,permease n=1 Tax=Arthrobacter crystallopoietes BAB-32 TaxID=1246476 RepID=N1V650_9MICC|nr:carbohydrate ABC transporter permease [Arthrobacter crystallopoietes]EMY33718.1 putative alpha-glucoside ABC transport system,permease [Arthrobacter crystallopoietes BAB-32]